ncbi:5'-3' exonuclease H3TH domain-containing protein [Streptomyces sp. NPDC092903]|uniref:5'-3' exonuclease n=1 Tax=Streptomyces sp. NPDC092903 TaxID=3366017 RepID=UPI00381A95DD
MRTRGSGPRTAKSVSGELQLLPGGVDEGRCLVSEDGSQAHVGQDSDYKAQRPAPEPGLIESLALAKDALDHSGVRWIEQDGCEADDVIATLATATRADGRAVDIMTTDKDYIQLLADPSVRLLNKGLAMECRYTGGEHVLPRYGVLAEQWPDFRALMGDPADNIPGIRGVGAKTAARLLTDARRLENTPASELRPTWTQQWPQALRWREMIKLDTKTDLPDELLTASPTAPLPKAPPVLEALGLW